MKTKLYAKRFIGKYYRAKMHYHRKIYPNGVGGYMKGAERSVVVYKEDVCSARL